MTKTHRFLIPGFVVACLLAFVPPAAAQEDYVKPSLSNLVKTLVRFGALDIRKDKVIDTFGRITECKIFKDHYRDDFRWQKVRAALRESIKENIATYPVGYAYDAPLQLDRYDFKTGQYRFTKKTAQANANVFTIDAKAEDFCVDLGYTGLPYSYKFILDNPVKLEGLPISAEEGNVLLQRMVKSENVNRIVYARFNIRVVYVDPMKGEEIEGRDFSAKTPYAPMVAQDAMADGAKMDSRLDSIEYFEDQERTKLIYRYVP